MLIVKKLPVSVAQALTFIACLAVPGTAIAQSAPVVPPVRTYVDANGIDLVGGYSQYEYPDLSVGPADGGLHLRLTLRGGGYYTGWTHNYAGFTTIGFYTGEIYLVLGTRRYSFFPSGSSYTTDSPGVTLTSTPTQYTFTDVDGTVILFNRGTGVSSTITRITKPSGEQIDYYSHGIVSSNGYQLHFDNSTPSGGFLSLGTTKITAINMAVDYCDPTAVNCTGLTQTWPSITVNRTSAVLNTLSDALSHSTRFDFVNEYAYPPGAPTPALFPHLSKVTDPSGVTTNYTFDPIDPSDPQSPVYVATVAKGTTYSGGGYVRTDPGGGLPVEVDAWEPDGAFRVIDIDPLTGLPTDDIYDGVAYSYTYDGWNLPQDIYADVHAHFTRDARGNTTEVRVKPLPSYSGPPVADIVTSATFDTTCANHKTCNKPNTTTDALGHVTNYTYDASSGGLATQTSPTDSSGVSPQVRNSYSQFYAWYKNSAGTIVQSTIPRWMLTQSSSCRSGTSPSCIGTANETRTLIGYGSTGVANNLLAVTNTVEAGDASLVATTTTGYDIYGNPASVDGPLSGTADTIYTRYNLMRQTVGVITPDPDGAGPLKYRATRTTYNVDNKPTLVERGTVNGVTDPDWAAFVSLQGRGTAYDASTGWKVRDTLVSGSSTYGLTQYSYDSHGVPNCTAVRMNPAVYSSLPASACTLGTSGSYGPDRITEKLYDFSARPRKIVTGLGTTAQADETTFTYTSSGKLATIKDGEGNLTSYQYDPFDRLVQTFYPMPAKGAQRPSATDYELLTLDANGQVTQRRLRDGSTISYTYDNLGRLIFKDRANVAWWETDISYAYDLMGRTLTASDSNGHVLSYTYDALGRQKTQASNWYGTLTSAYDLAGRRTQLTWPDGFYVNYDYDNADEVTAVRENGAVSGVGVLATYAWDDLGRRTSITRGNGTSTSYGYDAVSRLTSLGQDLAGTGYDLTVNGVSYNPASQLLGITRSNTAYSWTGGSLSASAYTSNGLNQYSAAGASSLGYDARGNLTSSGSTTYAYTQDNQLAQSGAYGFAYDPAGQLFYTTSNNSATLYDGPHPALERDFTSGAILRRFVFGPGTDEPIVWYEGSGTTSRRWLHADERGSIIAASDSSGNGLTIGSYDEFGIPAWSVPAYMPRFGYTGQAWLPDIARSYYKARVYAPTLGRLMQTDPTGYGDGINWYAYVGNDPLNRNDPSGLVCFKNAEGKSECYLDPVLVEGVQSTDANSAAQPGAGSTSNWGILPSGILGNLLGRIGQAPSAIFSGVGEFLFGSPAIAQSTGRGPDSLEERLAIAEARSNPSSAQIDTVPIVMNDPRWPAADGWEKRQWVHRSLDGGQIVVHFVYNRNTGQTDDFKIK